MKIVIAGGTGFIGRALVDRLLTSGHDIAVLTRNRRLIKLSMVRNLEFVSWDAATLSSWAKHLDGANAVINLAGEPLAGKRWTDRQKHVIMNSRIEATGAVVEALAEAKAKPAVLINLSAVGYYGDIPGGEVDESHPPGDNFVADVCVRWEAEARQAEKYNVRTAHLRAGLVLERDGGVLRKMLSTFKLHAGGIPGTGKQWVPWIHREDILSIIEFVLETERLAGPINAMSPNPVTMREFVSTLVKVINKPLRGTVPGIIIKAALGEMADMTLTGQKAIPRRLLEAGFKFKYPELKPALEAIFN